MATFMNADLFTMVKVLVSRFMKPAALSLIISSAHLLKAWSWQEGQSCWLQEYRHWVQYWDIIEGAYWEEESWQ